MRRHHLLPLLALSLFAVPSCTDSTSPTRTFAAPVGTRYQLSASGTLTGEIDALIVALFPKGLETAAGTRWDGIRSKVASGDLLTAKSKLLDLVAWVRSKESQMDAPPNGESRQAAVARLVLYMSLYVYDGPTTTPPPEFGTGADAVVSVVVPDSGTTVQTPLKHAGARFDAGAVSEPTIVVISQNTDYFEPHCAGPFTTKYCQYPLFYHYQAFPAQRFLHPVHAAVCHIHTGDDYGPLPGVDHDLMVLAHDKPANPAYFTTGGYPVPGENIELLPRAPTASTTDPLVACTGAVYPQVALFEYAPTRHDAVGRLLASAARGINRAASAVGAALSPRPAYAIDLGVETLTSSFSKFVDVDTTGRPDLAVTTTNVPVSAQAGQAINVSFVVANNGTAPSPGDTTSFQIVAVATTYVPVPVTIVTTSITGATGTLYPLQSRTEVATVVLPSTLPPGAYTVIPTVSSTGGMSELTSTLGNNSLGSPIEITALGRFAGATVDGVWSPGEWDVSRCTTLTVALPAGGTTPGTLCWQNSATDLYVSVRITSSADYATASLGMVFDNDASGTINAGDDAYVGNRQVGVFDDQYAPCLSSAGLCSFTDASLGGVNDGAQAWGFDGSSIVVETSHPLNSGDGHDIALTAGQVIGARFELRLLDGSAFADTNHPSSGTFVPVWTYAGGPFFSKSAPVSAVR